MGKDMLSLDNILGTEEIDNLFVEDVNSTGEEVPEVPEEKEQEKEKENKTTEVNVDTLFTTEPESVGSGKENIEEKEDTPPTEDGTSPKTFYSSIAKALKEEGIFPDLDEEVLSKIKDPEDFREIVEQQIRSNLDERQKRIDDALNVGAEPTEIRKYENAIRFLESIKEESITEEGDNGEKLRKDLIYQDFINRGYSKERANREVQKSLNAGTDVDDAKEALRSNIEYFNAKYEEYIEETKLEAEKADNERKEQAEKLKTSILNDKDVFGDFSIDKATRQKVYDNIAKPIYRDPETGQFYTALQKYEMEHRMDFLKNIGVLFTLTNGFKNLDALVKNKVNKEVKKGLRELEHTLNNTSRTSDGNLKFVSGVSDDPESFIGKGWKLDV